MKVTVCIYLATPDSEEGLVVTAKKKEALQESTKELCLRMCLITFQSMAVKAIRLGLRSHVIAVQNELMHPEK